MSSFLFYFHLISRCLALRLFRERSELLPGFYCQSLLLHRLCAFSSHLSTFAKKMLCALCCSPLHTATLNNRHIQHMRLAGFKLPEGRMNTWKSVLFNRKNSFCLCFPFFFRARQVTLLFYDSVIFLTVFSHLISGCDLLLSYSLTRQKAQI